jgi:hypothetical protein
MLKALSQTVNPSPTISRVVDSQESLTPLETSRASLRKSRMPLNNAERSHRRSRLS